MNKIIKTLICAITGVALLTACNANTTTNTSISELLDGETVATTSNPYFQMYSVEGMSADDIISLFERLTDVSTGDLIMEYSERFDVAPESINDGAFGFYVSDDSTDTDYIKQIHIEQVEPDGTITITDRSYVQVHLILSDADAASAIYDYAYNLASEAPNDVESSFDYREGTYWTSSINGYSQELVEREENYELLLMLPLLER